MAWGWDELVERPVLEHKAQGKHQDAQGPEHGDRGNLSIVAILKPEPLQEEHRQAIDRPEREHAPDGVRGGEFPGDLDGIAEDLAWRERSAVTVQGTVEGRMEVPAMTSGPWKFSSGWR
jgi:hypothetical protein